MVEVYNSICYIWTCNLFWVSIVTEVRLALLVKLFWVSIVTEI